MRSVGGVGGTIFRGVGGVGTCSAEFGSQGGLVGVGWV